MNPPATTPAATGFATSNLRIRSLEPLIPPARLMALLPLDDAATATIVSGRREVERVLAGEDPRLLAVVGPCSIHDLDAAREYAGRLKALADRVADRLLVVMRVYFEKPRTTVGWKGLINDPHRDDSFDVATGLRLARGLSMPVGFKNSTDGSLQAAVDAMQSARAPHSFLGIDNEGGTAVVSTTGNPWGVLMLRGGRSGSNYSAEVMEEARTKLEKAGLPARIIVDCSHANSGKDPTRQSVVWRDVLEQRRAGDTSIVGMMLESNIHPGSQPAVRDRSKLQYGVSITDACIGWGETEELLLEAHARL